MTTEFKTYEAASEGEAIIRLLEGVQHLLVEIRDELRLQAGPSAEEIRRQAREIFEEWRRLGMLQLAPSPVRVPLAPPTMVYGVGIMDEDLGEQMRPRTTITAGTAGGDHE